MRDEKNKKNDFQTLQAPLKKGGVKSHDQETLRPSSGKTANGAAAKNDLINPQVTPADGKKPTTKETPPEAIPEKNESASAELRISEKNFHPPVEENNQADYAESVKLRKKEKKNARDRELLEGEKWFTRNGHSLTYIGLYLFSILVFFRPYELIPGLSFLSATAFYFALATLIIYIPAQLATEGSLTVLSTEVKCVLALALIALLTMPIAKHPPTAWATFNDSFSKAVLMFIIMVNVLRTRQRLVGLMWLSLAVGIYLSFTALDLYMKGEFKVEGYRVDVEVKGLFGNPNDLALHLVTMTPLAVALGFGSRGKLMRVVYFGAAALFIAANVVTFSRGGFLGLIALSAVLAWKLGRRNRLKVSLVSIVVGGLFLLLAPGNYGLRILSIFIPGLDAVGSSDQRRELLERSILVSLRNPWGIGIGNFPIVGIRNLVTHNAFTQVSSELGVLGLLAYVIFMVSRFARYFSPGETTSQNPAPAQTPDQTRRIGRADFF